MTETSSLTPIGNPELLTLGARQRKELGHRLRKLRTGHGLSAAHVASEVLGTATSTLTRIERGETLRLRRATVESIARHLGQNLEGLLVHDDGKAPRGSRHSASSSVAGPAVAAKPVPEARPVASIAPEFIGSEGEDLRHDPEGWTSTRAHAPRYAHARSKSSR